MALKLRLLKRLDLSLLICAGLLLIFGLFVLFSATFDQFVDVTISYLFLFKQLLAILLGLLLMFLFIYLDYHFLEKYAEVFYFFILGLLLVVISMGTVTTGVQRWLNFGLFNLQPSELAKLAVIIILAKYLANKKGNLNSLVDLLPAILITGIPFILIFKQPDLGTAFTFLIILIGMSYWAGTRPLLIFLLASPFISILVLHSISFMPWVIWGFYLLALLYILHINKINLVDTATFFIMNVLSGTLSPLLWNSLRFYQQQRLLSFINPLTDPLAQGVRYHTAKSVIAIGSGKIFGQGFLKGPLTHLHYIPEHHTDFIFTVIGEEFGFLGTIIVLGLLGYVIFRGIKIAAGAHDNFGSILASGIVIFFMFQIVLNISMTVGLMPVVGIPLPLLSSGGSAMVTSLIAIGILESVAIHQKKLFF